MFKRYLKDTSGQFAIMFSVCATALIFGLGAAIDMAGMQKQRTQLQALTDVAALAAASTKSENVADLKKIAAEVIAANNFEGLDLTHKLSLNGDIIQVEATTSYATQLMGVVGVKDLPIGARSSAPIPKDVPVNIALVLDETGSMSGPNMTALQSASKKLLEVFDEADPGSIQVGIIPFSTYVNVGLGNRDRPWTDVPDDSSTTGTEVCYMTRDIVDSSKCTTTTTPSTCYNDSGSYDCNKSTNTCTDDAYGPEYEYCYTPTSSQTWYGCIGSRDDPDHKDPDYKGRSFPGIMNTNCASEILDLTDNLSTVQSKIDTLSASGNTYIPAGLAWGWRMLDPDLPYGGLTNSQTDRKRALVLMSDGGNTVKLSAPNHWFDSDQSDIPATNQLTLELCDGIKAAGIDLYSVSYKLGETGDLNAKKMIQDCASGSEFAFSADSQAELEKAFEDIARSLYEVRLIK